MAAQYRAVMLTKKGGPDALRIVELPIDPPGPAQLRVRVRAAGVGATDLIIRVGDRVAALTVYGGFAEILVREAEHFIPIPGGVSDRDAATVILNYVTAWQMIHRSAKVKSGHTALVMGAAGGVGSSNRRASITRSTRSEAPTSAIAWACFGAAGRWSDLVS